MKREDEYHNTKTLCDACGKEGAMSGIYDSAYNGSIDVCYECDKIRQAVPNLFWMIVKAAKFYYDLGVAAARDAVLKELHWERDQEKKEEKPT